jgi:hypothetical protein
LWRSGNLRSKTKAHAGVEHWESATACGSGSEGSVVTTECAGEMQQGQDYVRPFLAFPHISLPQRVPTLADTLAELRMHLTCPLSTQPHSQVHFLGMKVDRLFIGHQISIPTFFPAHCILCVQSNNVPSPWR